LIGLNGPVTIRRARFRCTKTGAFEYPLDQELDLPPHEVTVSLARRALRLATHMSFATLQEELHYPHEVRLSDTVLDRLMQAAGGVAEQDRASSATAERGATRWRGTTSTTPRGFWIGII
jgi:hypothetical protein